MFIQESPFSEQILTLSKPLGKDISLRVGEIIEGEVVDLFPGGGMTLKIKGGYLPVRTSLPFSKNEVLQLRVLGWGGKNGEVALQFLGDKEKSQRAPIPDNQVDASTEGKKSLLSDSEGLLKLVEEFQKSVKLGSGDPGRPETILGKIIKAFIKEPGLSIEKIRSNIILTLKETLQEGLPQMAQRISSFLERLPEEWLRGVIPLKIGDRGLMSVEGLNGFMLKEVVENSGVVLEAKLKALMQNAGEGMEVPLNKNNKIVNDSKYILIKLKSIVDEKISSEIHLNPLRSELGEKGIKKMEEAYAFLKNMSGEIESLLLEVETFQVLSKATDSFFTFLPIPWDWLKQGELIFKKRERYGEPLFSCGIHLKLDGVGEVSVGLLMQENKFFIEFKVEDLQFKTLISSSLDELKEAFSGQGLPLAHITFKEKKEDPADPLKNILTGDTLVSIRI